MKKLLLFFILNEIWNGTFRANEFVECCFYVHDIVSKKLQLIDEEKIYELTFKENIL